MSNRKNRIPPTKEKKDFTDNLSENTNNTEKIVQEQTKLNNVLCFKFENQSENTPFVISSCEVNNLLLEGVIFSPNYDLLIYFIDSNLLEDKQELFFSIKIEVFANSKKNKHCNYRLTSRFSKENYFTRFSGLFDEIKTTGFTVNASFDLKTPKILKNMSTPQTFHKKLFNFIELETIKGKQIYNTNEILDANNISDKLKQFNTKYNFFISFNGTEEIIGPFNNEKILGKSLISQHYTHIIPVPKEIKPETKTDKLFFFVENINNKNSEFFGIFPSSAIKKIFSTSYNLSVNNMRFDPKTDNYPSGTVVCATLKRK